ncbi:MAG: hypothetical protein Q8P67_18560, partial [archaeon]|nr:hypothetical protein [archaeon]
EGGGSRSWALDALRAAHNVLRRQEGSTGASTRNQIVFMSPFNMPIEGPLHETLRALTRERVEVELCSIVSPVLQHQTVGAGGAAGLLKLRKLQDTYLNLRLTRVHNELGSYHGLMKRLIGDTVAAVPRGSRLVIGAQEVACSVQMGAVSLGFRLEPGDRHVTEVQLRCIASVPLEAMSACFFFDVPYFVGASTDAAMPIEEADANLTKFVSFVSALKTAGLGVLVQANTLLPVCAVSPATMPLYFLSPPHGTGEEGNGLLLMHRVVSRDTVLPIILPNLDGVQDLQQEAMFKEALLELKKDCYDPLQWPSIN